jgi:hypothetical protein
VPTSTPIAAWPIGPVAQLDPKTSPDNGKRPTYSPAGAASSPVTPAKAAAPAAASAPAAAKPATPVQAAKPAGPLECRVTCRTDAISGRRMFKTMAHPNKSPCYANVGAQKDIEAAAKKFDLNILVNMLYPEYKTYEKACRESGFWSTC